MSPVSNTKGYLVVMLNGRQFLVSRVILETFVGPPEPGDHARHLNGNHTDNRLVNLAWGSATMNAADRLGHGTQAHGERHGNSRLTKDQVVEIVRLATAGVPQAQIASQYGIAAGTVGKIHRGEQWSRATGLPLRKGGKGGRPKLTGEQIDEIVALRTTGKTHAVIGALFGVTGGAVRLRLIERGMH